MKHLPAIHKDGQPLAAPSEAFNVGPDCGLAAELAGCRETSQRLFLRRGNVLTDVKDRCLEWKRIWEQSS